MSTNYYVRPPGTPDGDEGIHLGQYAKTDDNRGQGRFLPRAHPDRGVIDRASWIAQLDLGPILAEYGVEVSKDEMVEMLDTRRPAKSWAYTPHSSELVDPDGYLFCKVEFS